MPTSLHCFSERTIREWHGNGIRMGKSGFGVGEGDTEEAEKMDDALEGDDADQALPAILTCSIFCIEFGTICATRSRSVPGIRKQIYNSLSKARIPTCPSVRRQIFFKYSSFRLQSQSRELRSQREYPYCGIIHCSSSPLLSLLSCSLLLDLFAGLGCCIGIAATREGQEGGWDAASVNGSRQHSAGQARRDEMAARIVGLNEDIQDQLWINCGSIVDQLLFLWSRSSYSGWGQC